MKREKSRGGMEKIERRQTREGKGGIRQKSATDKDRESKIERRIER